MPDLPFTNRELAEKFGHILDHMTHFETDVKDRLDGLIEQTTKTNGRVRWAEKMIYLALGFCSCVSILLLPLVWALISSGRL